MCFDRQKDSLILSCVTSTIFTTEMVNLEMKILIKDNLSFADSHM